MNQGTAIDLHEVCVHARGRTILDIARLRVQTGEVLGVLGPNGAGKTTLLRVLTGFIRSTGTAEVLGQRINELGSLALTRLRRRVGYVPQLLSAGGEVPLTIREVVAIGRTGLRGLLRGLNASDWSVVDHWIERLGVGEVAHAAYTETSGGQQRKALLARVMAQEPQLLLLDEPAAHLDIGAREQVVESIEKLHLESGVTVVAVCHELESLPPSCKRVILLQDGQIRGDGPIEQVMDEQTMRALYGPSLRVIHHNGRHAIVPGGPP